MNGRATVAARARAKGSGLVITTRADFLRRMWGYSLGKDETEVYETIAEVNGEIHSEIVRSDVDQFRYSAHASLLENANEFAAIVALDNETTGGARHYLEAENVVSVFEPDGHNFACPTLGREDRYSIADYLHFRFPFVVEKRIASEDRKGKKGPKTWLTDSYRSIAQR